MGIKETADWLPFTIGTMVALKCGDGLEKGMVNGILITSGAEKYMVRWADNTTSFHWEHELIEPPEFI